MAGHGVDCGLEVEETGLAVWAFKALFALLSDGIPLIAKSAMSGDGRFFMFTSSWDGQLGTEKNGTPRSDVFIGRLD